MLLKLHCNKPSKPCTTIFNHLSTTHIIVVVWLLATRESCRLDGAGWMWHAHQPPAKTRMVKRESYNDNLKQSVGTWNVCTEVLNLLFESCSISILATSRDRFLLRVLKILSSTGTSATPRFEEKSVFCCLWLDSTMITRQVWTSKLDPTNRT